MWQMKRRPSGRFLSSFLALLLVITTVLNPLCSVPTYATENKVSLTYDYVSEKGAYVEPDDSAAELVELLPVEINEPETLKAGKNYTMTLTLELDDSTDWVTIKTITTSRTGEASPSNASPSNATESDVTTKIEELLSSIRYELTTYGAEFQNVKIKNVGKVLFTNDIYTGMVSIGVIRIDALETNQFPTIFNNKGTFLISGALKMHPGSCLFVASNASLSTGNHVGFGANTKVVCCKSIIIGDDVRFSWNCQLFDTDFHFLYNIEKKKHYKRLKEIVIGNNVFIGNGSTIGKGTIIPNGCVISCISKVSGDYTNDGENLLLIGNPAKIIKKGVNMGNSWFPEIENEIAKMLKE